VGEDDPVTRREFAAGVAAITDRLDTLNGTVAENTRFRVQSKAVYGVILFAWGTVIIPLSVILVRVLS